MKIKQMGGSPITQGYERAPDGANNDNKCYDFDDNADTDRLLGVGCVPVIIIIINIIIIITMTTQILNVGLEWAGFPALAFYMHSVLKQLQVK